MGDAGQQLNEVPPNYRVRRASDGMNQLPAIHTHRLRVAARNLLQRIGGAEPHQRSLRAQGGDQRRHNGGIACRTPNDTAHLADGDGRPCRHGQTVEQAPRNVGRRIPRLNLRRELEVR